MARWYSKTGPSSASKFARGGGRRGLKRGEPFQASWFEDLLPCFDDRCDQLVASAEVIPDGGTVPLACLGDHLPQRHCGSLFGDQPFSRVDERGPSRSLAAVVHWQTVSQSYCQNNPYVLASDGIVPSVRVEVRCLAWVRYLLMQRSSPRSAGAVDRHAQSRVSVRDVSVRRGGNGVRGRSVHRGRVDLELTYGGAENGLPTNVVLKVARPELPAFPLYRNEVAAYSRLQPWRFLRTPRCLGAWFDERTGSFGLALDDLTTSGLASLRPLPHRRWQASKTPSSSWQHCTLGTGAPVSIGRRRNWNGRKLMWRASCTTCSTIPIWCRR